MISELFWQCSTSYIISELIWQCGIFLHDLGTALTVFYFSTCISTWFLNCSDSVVFSTSFLNYSGMILELLWKYCIFVHVFLDDFGTALTVLYFSICICTRPGKWTVMYLCIRSFGVCLSSRILLHDYGTVLTMWYFLHDFGTALTVLYFSTCFSTWFRNCTDSVVFLNMISELFWQCSISYMISELLWQCSISYMISKLFCQCSIPYITSELLWQCCIFLHDFGTALTVLYFSTWFLNCSDSVVYPTWFLNCSDSVVILTWFLNCSDCVVFFYIISELLWHCSIFLHDFGTALKVWYLFFILYSVFPGFSGICVVLTFVFCVLFSR